MSTKLKYILQSNVFVLNKYKEAKNSKKIETLSCAYTKRTANIKLYRAFYKGARQNKTLPCVFILAYDKVFFHNYS
jgi:hypothetical protein